MCCKKRIFNSGIVRVYEGESSRNAKIRTFIRGLKKCKKGNPLFKHRENVHLDENVEFKMEVKQKFKDPLTRLAIANEGVQIKNRKPEELLNSKSEFHQPRLERLLVEKKNRK